MKNGFTLIETLLVMGIVALLFVFSSIALGNLVPRSFSTTSVETIIADLRQQQSKAMLGEIDGSGSSKAYGVHYDSDGYVLFAGDTYNPSDPANSPISVEVILSLSTTFAGSDVIFSRVNGEIVGFTAGANTITLTNTANGDQKIITLNKLGVVEGVQ